MTSIAAIVPMRHHSERVPGKNYREFAGRPLFHRVIEALRKASLVSEIVIDTDSDRIFADAGENFPEIRIVERPEHLRAGDVPMNDVLLHTTAQVTADLYLQTHSTNPLLRSETIDRAIEAFLAARDTHDSLFSVTRLQTRLWTQDGEPVNHDPEVLLRTQDLEPLFEENSNLFIFSRSTLTERRNRIGHRPLLFPMDADEAWDIDEPLDFDIAQFLYERRRGTG